MMSGLSVHIPTLSSDTSTSVAIPVRSRWNKAVPIAPAIVLAPCKSKNVAGWNIGSPPACDILTAMAADAQPAARSNPPVLPMGPRAPHPLPQA